MRKTLLAASAALALCSMTGAASAADVELYGLIITGFSYVHSDADVAGADNKDSFTMETGKEFGSRWGIRGTEDLGNGYKVGFVLESGFRSDDGTFDQSGKLFGRESRINLMTPYGRLSFGVLPLFGSTLGADGLFRAIDPLFANYTQAFGSGFASASSWTRVDNAVSYVTPTFGGVTGYAMYPFKNSASGQGTEGKGGEADRYASLALRYKAGAFESVLVADTTMYGSARTGANAHEDNGYTVTLGGNYTFGNGLKLLAFAQNFQDQELNAARGRGGVALDGIKHYADLTNGENGNYGFVDGWGGSLGVNFPLLGGTAKGQVAYRDMDNQDDVNFKRWTVCAGYDYNLSKRTAVYAMTGWTQEKIENTKANKEGKPSGYEFTFGMVHRF